MEKFVKSNWRKKTETSDRESRKQHFKILNDKRGLASLYRGRSKKANFAESRRVFLVGAARRHCLRFFGGAGFRSTRTRFCGERFDFTNESRKSCIARRARAGFALNRVGACRQRRRGNERGF